MPGVSTSISCTSPAIAIPISRVRVVCTLGLTIATFWPTSALVSVDLPAFGAPTMATTPQCSVIWVRSFYQLLQHGGGGPGFGLLFRSAFGRHRLKSLYHDFHLESRRMKIGRTHV